MASALDLYCRAMPIASSPVSYGPVDVGGGGEKGQLGGCSTMDAGSMAMSNGSMNGRGCTLPMAGNMDAGSMAMSSNGDMPMATLSMPHCCTMPMAGHPVACGCAGSMESRMPSNGGMNVRGDMVDAILRFEYARSGSLLGPSESLEAQAWKDGFEAGFELHAKAHAWMTGYLAGLSSRATSSSRATARSFAF